MYSISFFFRFNVSIPCLDQDGNVISNYPDHESPWQPNPTLDHYPSPTSLVGSFHGQMSDGDLFDSPVPSPTFKSFLDSSHGFNTRNANPSNNSILDAVDSANEEKTAKRKPRKKSNLKKSWVEQVKNGGCR